MMLDAIRGAHLNSSVRHLLLAQGMDLRTRKLLTIFVALAAVWLPALAASPRKDDNLYLVKRIYVAGEPLCTVNEYCAAVEKRMNSYLRRELADVGFTTVDDVAKADAVLKGSIGEEVVLDGVQPDPPKYIYEYQLTYPNKERAWRTKFNIRSKANQAEVDGSAARKIAQNLLKAWQKSAKRAGLSVGDGVQ
jgi:hypothetical protein